MTVKQNAATTPADDVEAFYERMALSSAPAWMPEPNSILEGVVTGIRLNENSEYGAYPVIVYKKDDGTFIAFHAFHTLARNMMRELQTAKGKRQRIAYLGVQTKNNPTEDEVKKGLDKYNLYYGENVGEVKPDVEIQF
jgi:hypothetical protein